MPEQPGQIEQAAARKSTTPATTEPPEPPKLTIAQAVGQVLTKQVERIRSVSPTGFDAERFANLVITAVKATPQLMECFGSAQGEMSVLLAAMQAAEVGLEPNTPLQHCWILPRRKGTQMEAQLSIGYRGYIDLAGRSERVKTIFAEVVRDHDQFHWARGLEADTLEHVPAAGERGDLCAAYAVVRYTNGGYNFVVLDRAAVEKRRASSDSYKGDRSRPFSPWVTNEEAMWKKSAVRALVPYLPLAAAAARAVAVDESTLGMTDDDEVIATYHVDDPDAIETSTS